MVALRQTALFRRTRTLAMVCLAAADAVER